MTTGIENEEQNNVHQLDDHQLDDDEDVDNENDEDNGDKLSLKYDKDDDKKSNEYDAEDSEKNYDAGDDGEDNGGEIDRNESDEANVKIEASDSKLTEGKEEELTKEAKTEVDYMIAEPASELVAAAEDDAKNNKDQTPPSDHAVRPNNRDILFGRGKPFQNHPGNRKMLGLIDQYGVQYRESPRDQKRPIVEEIIGILSNEGGRFLRRFNEDANSTWWIEVDKKVAFDKVSHAFRSRARPKQPHSADAKVNISSLGTLHHGQHHNQFPHQHPHFQPPQLHDQGHPHQYVAQHYNPMLAALGQQQPHPSALMGFHPMPPGLSVQQQAIMQAGMMTLMQQQQQQQQHSGYGQAPQSPYQHQKSPVRLNPYSYLQPPSFSEGYNQSFQFQLPNMVGQRSTTPTTTSRGEGSDQSPRNEQENNSTSIGI